MEENPKSPNSFDGEQGKDTKNKGGERSLNPKFEDLKDPKTLINHAEELRKESVTPHTEILACLLRQFEPVDFKLLAFPQIKKLRERLATAVSGSDQAKEIQRQLDRFRLKQKHYLVLSIENVLQLAKNNRWGLCMKHDFIYVFNGAFWSEIDKDAFQKFLGDAAEKMGVERFDARLYQFREKLFKQFLATSYLPTPASNNETVLINLLNGTFEVSPSGGILRSFDRSDFMTYQLPFEFDSEAKAPLFEEYLNRVLPDPERQRVLAEFIGYIFIKHGSKALKEEKALILYGAGANGKSVFFEIINALLGTNNVSTYSLQSLTNINGYYRAKLANRLVNYASEINGKLETATFKQLVSGEPVEARLPYGQPFILDQYAKLVFNCNELPKDVEHTPAYFRRFLIIPFNVTIPQEEQDKNLHNKIIEKELSGVFNWVLDGLDRLLKQGSFSNCEAAKKALEQYKLESNSIQLFLEETGYKGSPEKYRLLKEIYPEYRSFCYEDGMTAFKKINFSKQLEAQGIRKGREPGTGKTIFYMDKGDEPF